jgi:hypothetical protein
MGGDDSQKLLPWRGFYSSPGRNLRLTTESHFSPKTSARSRPPSRYGFMQCLVPCVQSK